MRRSPLLAAALSCALVSANAFGAGGAACEEEEAREGCASGPRPGRAGGRSEGAATAGRVPLRPSVDEPRRPDDVDERLDAPPRAAAAPQAAASAAPASVSLGGHEEPSQAHSHRSRRALAADENVALEEPASSRGCDGST